MKKNYRVKRLLALLTALSISMGVSGCTYSDKSSKNNNSTKEIDISKDSISTPTPTLSPEEVKALELEKLVDDYLAYFSSIEVSYPHEDLYPSEREINKILAKDETYQEYEHKDTVTVDELFNMIKKNSIQYAKQHPKFRTPFYSSKLPLQQWKSSFYFKCALNRVLKEMKKESTNDYLEDICKMKDLKIVFGELNSSKTYSIYGEYDSKHNRIILDSKAIENMEKKRKYDDEVEFYEDVLKHEFSHLRSVACKHRIKKGQKFKEILKSKSVPTIFESSAESSIYAMDEYGYLNVDSLDFLYPFEREDESLILLLGLFHDDKTYEDYYNAIADSNPEAFYDFCGVKEVEEKHTLYKILAAIDGKNCRNDIVNKVKKTDKISLLDGKETIRYNYKLDIFHKVLSNMIDYTSTHPDFTIEKNLEMLNIVENCILDWNIYLKQKNSYDQEFILDIYQSETKYLDFLASYYFSGEGKNHNFIKQYYQYDDVYSDITYDHIQNITCGDELINEFPLLKPILFVHDISAYSRKDFLEENKKVIKQNLSK